MAGLISDKCLVCAGPLASYYAGVPAMFLWYLSNSVVNVVVVTIIAGPMGHGKLKSLRFCLLVGMKYVCQSI